MSFVAAKCTQCGASIEVDPNTEAGICKYCGAPFITQKAIINYNATFINNNTISANQVVIGTGNFEAFYKLAMNSWNSRDYNEAYNYFSKALELNSNDIDAQIYRALSSAWKSTDDNILLSAPDATYSNIYLNETIKRADEVISRDIYLYLDVISATADLAESVYNPCWPTDATAVKLWSILLYCKKSAEIAIEISEKYLSNDDYKSTVIESLQLYSNILVKLTKKRQYDTGITGGLVDIKKIYCPNDQTYLQQLEDNNKKINDLDDNAEIPTADRESGGCYIATCVYGSYDCPQVWVLRRYRDETLGATWYGRLFIKLYYAISPTLVKLFGHTKWFKTMWKAKLDNMVVDLQAKGFESMPYIDENWRKRR